MNALDTNILVRFLIQDDKAQANKVNNLLASSEQDKETLFIPILVILELIWVLQSVYEVKRKDIILALSTLLQMPVLAFEKQSTLRECIISAEQFSGDLSDILISHSALSSSCKTVLTFDKKATKFKHFTLL